ncbi:pyridoxal phosphate-dependent aminotransferase [Thermoanaerobacter brockii subsp. lactiethylicus]|uniref:Aminotransferase n=2 Tax=Thermoanaerobacter TaxID=1754 RepID=B0K9M5_THEP3|nr:MULTISPECIES: pyridoxal phosphate-dependent aminotransferase [Thermoanaerobacter]ABY92907.1 aminotransferase, class I and II [Thermoanaerobacter sp. X514]ABY94838.1 aminotransferase, class I and II [Thermoanaerobacter pseudethanolicus ATCC 33223]ADV79787.1 aminotransferase class I and II [Thermoanaerobacter brockii subsp. finnii Ako-1]MDI3528750.1 aspartate aminotransferase [Thermoanaerobacter sp.]MDK2815274.1 aspartate aminotransferase [Thermoanaerobacter sp.]
MDLSQNALQITPSMTLEITAKAKQLKAQGVDVIDFGVGEPDFDTSDYIKEAAIDAIKKGYTKYTPSSGISELKKAVCNKLLKDNSLKYQPEQIVISNGAKHSIYNALCAILNPGDEVIIPVPYWLSYPEMVRLAYGKPVFVKTKAENDFKITAEELKNAITSKTKALILNTPNNPTGSVYTKEELEELAKIIEEANIFVISDEIYEKLIYEGSHISIASLNEKIKELTILVNGMSKAYAMTGWRIGYTASSLEIAKVMSNIQSHTTSNPNSIAQYASVAALSGDETVIKRMAEEFNKRRIYMVERINKIKGLKSNKPQGAFYVMVNIDEYIGKEIKGKIIRGSIDFANALIEGANVAVVPALPFGMDNYIRISYATSIENIEKGLNRIEEFLNKA